MERFIHDIWNEQKSGKYLAFESGGLRYVVVMVGCNHKDIAEWVWKQNPDEKLRVVGGGYFSYEKEGKKIELNDLSGDFGAERDRRKSAEVVKIAFPEWEVSFSERD